MTTKKLTATQHTAESRLTTHHALKSQPIRELNLTAPIETELRMLSTDGTSGWRGNNRRRTADGSIERLPSLAHVANPDAKHREFHPRAESRYEMMLDAQGNELAVVLTNGASILPDPRRPDDDLYTRHVMAKSFATGRIPTQRGCIVRLHKAGEINPRKLAAQELLSAHVCKPGAAKCPHLEIERKARQERNAVAMADIEQRMKSDEVKRSEKLESLLVAVAEKVTQ